MNALPIIDRELEWWDAKCRSMKHPREQLALACAIGAVSALRNVRDAIAAGSRRAKTPQAVECEASQSGPKGIARNVSPSQPSKGQ